MTIYSCPVAAAAAATATPSSWSIVLACHHPWAGVHVYFHALKIRFRNRLSSEGTCWLLFPSCCVLMIMFPARCWLTCICSHRTWLQTVLKKMSTNHTSACKRIKTVFKHEAFPTPASILMTSSIRTVFADTWLFAPPPNAISIDNWSAEPLGLRQGVRLGWTASRRHVDITSRARRVAPSVEDSRRPPHSSLHRYTVLMIILFIHKEVRTNRLWRTRGLVGVGFYRDVPVRLAVTRNMCRHK